MKQTYKKPEMRVTRLSMRTKMLEQSGEPKRMRYNEDYVDSNLEAL